jgi:hypothetical protein
MQGHAEDTTEDWSGEFLAPVTMQWWPPPQLRPEHRLMRAVLEKALGDLALEGATEPPPLVGYRRPPVLDWFVSRDRSWPFSFENICDAIDLDPGRVRAVLGTLPHWRARWP